MSFPFQALRLSEKQPKLSGNLKNSRRGGVEEFMGQGATCPVHPGFYTG